MAPNVFVWDVPSLLGHFDSSFPLFSIEFHVAEIEELQWTVNNLEVEEALGFRIRDALGQVANLAIRQEIS